MWKPRILIDFDDTINSYLTPKKDGKWDPTYLPDAPILGAKEGIAQLSEQYQITIFTTRAQTEAGEKAIREWLLKHQIYFDEVTALKLPANLILDDKCLTFKGDWNQMLSDVQNFLHWRKQETTAIIELLVGNIGLGKSTYARQRAKEGNCAIVCMDEIIAMAEGNRLDYKKENGPIYWSIEYSMLESALQLNKDVIIDRTNMTRKIRSRFIQFALAHGAKVKCLNFGQGSEEGLKRRILDNRGKDEMRWREVYEKLRQEYESPNLDEGFESIT